jgi:hypothetical protein
VQPLQMASCRAAGARGLRGGAASVFVPPPAVPMAAMDFVVSISRTIPKLFCASPPCVTKSVHVAGASACCWRLRRAVRQGEQLLPPLQLSTQPKQSAPSSERDPVSKIFPSQNLHCPPTSSTPPATSLQSTRELSTPVEEYTAAS